MITFCGRVRDLFHQCVGFIWKRCFDAGGERTRFGRCVFNRINVLLIRGFPSTIPLPLLLLLSLQFLLPLPLILSLPFLIPLPLVLPASLTVFPPASSPTSASSLAPVPSPTSAASPTSASSPSSANSPVAASLPVLAPASHSSWASFRNFHRPPRHLGMTRSLAENSTIH